MCRSVVFGCRIVLLVLCALGALSQLRAQNATSISTELQTALEAAGDNQQVIQQALDKVPDAHTPAMRFLIENMPAKDLQSLSAEFLLEHVRLAYLARKQAKWGPQIPESVFLNNVLPYANVNERRDDVRHMLREKFWPSIQELDSISQAAAQLNQQVFRELQVKYSTKRRRADQGVLESVESGLASCTGLSILLIDACRACGIPARFVGTPLWSDGSGNHSWVEVWDDGWHFTGAAEPTGDELDKAWFIGRASKATVGDPRHGIFAVSYRKTDLKFPLVWARSRSELPEVYAVEVTERYAKPQPDFRDNLVELKFRALGPAGIDRCQANLVVKDLQDKVIFRGQTKNESFDANDHLTARLEPGRYIVELTTASNGLIRQSIEVGQEEKLVTLRAEADKSGKSAVAELAKLLEQQPAGQEQGVWQDLLEQSFASIALSREEAERATRILAEAYETYIRKTRAQEHAEKRISLGELEMKYDYTVFGADDPKSLVISMHGGGGAPKRVNDRQWQNQKSLYKLDSGIYLAPRAPTDKWNLWHQKHIDAFFTRLIENMIALEGIDSDRVYITGYSAGGDGVFQLAPRMADQLAGAAMMAGHPNETLPDGLRNLPFTLHMGEKDAAYNRNQKAGEWKELLGDLRTSDPAGYEHWVKIHPGKGHWMGGDDAEGVAWMTKFTRNLLPEKVVWLQDDVLHQRFYWLAMDAEHAQPRQRVVASRQGNRITIEQCDAEAVTLLLRDDMVDLDQPIVVCYGEKEVYTGKVQRTIADLLRTLMDHGDRKAMFSASLSLEIR